METAYTMIGADGQQYGPISLDQIKTWIAEGRIAGDTKIQRSDTRSWLPAWQYPELGLAQAPPAAAPPPPLSATAPPASAQVQDPLLERRARMGARWFFWIAGLSLFNTFSMISSSTPTVFVVGLAVTRKIYEFSGPEAAGTALNIVVSGLFALLGVFAWKRQNWSYIAGLVLYGLDTLLALSYSDGNGFGLAVGFHIFVMFWIFRGLQANLRLKAPTGGPVV